jgi:hypothetical protein
VRSAPLVLSLSKDERRRSWFDRFTVSGGVSRRLRDRIVRSRRDARQRLRERADDVGVEFGTGAPPQLAQRVA